MITRNLDIIGAYLRQGIIPKGNVFDTGKTAVNENITRAVTAELASLGFVVHPDSLDGFNLEYLEKILDSARVVVGTDRFSTRPMYVNFPDQVKNMDTIDLIIDQIVHYLSAGTLLPDHEDVIVRPSLPLADVIDNGKTLEVADIDPVTEINRLVTKSVAVNENERDIVRLLLWSVYDRDLSPWTDIYVRARNHENAQVLVSAIVDVSDKDNLKDVVTAFINETTNTDRLLRVMLTSYSTIAKDREAYNRAVTELSDKDHWSVKMVSAPKAVRRALLNALGRITSRGRYSADGLISRNNLWRRVMRMVHPFSLSLTDSALYAADVIHDNVSYVTYNGAVEKAIAQEDVNETVSLLSQRPGNLMRRLVAVARMPGFTRDHAKKVADVIENSNTSLTTLISSYNGVVNANESGSRIVRVKGGNTVVDENRATAKYTDIIAKGILGGITKVLVTKDAPISPVGIDGDYPVPLVARDASDTDRKISRGQVIARFEDTDVLRLFTHWVNSGDVSDYWYSGTDVDLGVNLYDSDLTCIQSANYTNYGNSRDFLTFSGDIVDAPAPNGASEYFDIDIAKVRKFKKDTRWIALSSIVYSGLRFKDIDHVHGVMVRSVDNAGEIFDPRSVAASGSSNADSRSVTSLVVDLENNTVIWVDSSIGSQDSYSNTTSQGDDIAAVIRSEITRESLTVGELASMWANAHGIETVDEDVDVNALESLL